MREFFEGDPWRERRLELHRVRAASARYSLIVSVAVIVTTVEGFLVLQRRSHLVQAAVGGIAASATGTVRWRDLEVHRPVGQGARRRIDLTVRSGSLRRAVFRQLREEIALSRDDFEEDPAPFLAAAFNLRYGRDLSFYCHLASRLTRAEVSKRFAMRRGLRARLKGVGKDRWEAAHLVFVPVEEIAADGSPSPFLSSILGDSRHVRGALYAFAMSERRDTVLERRALAPRW